MMSLAEQIIVDILATKMDLSDQSVWIRNQNRKIPETDELFIVVGMVDAQPICVNKEMIPITIPQPDPTPDIQTLQESLTVVARENIQIDILSRNTDALMRRYEVLTALASTYATQKQEENNFKIFRVPINFVNASEAEGGSRINRFSITIPCHVWYRNIETLDVGDTFCEFSTRVDDYKTIDDVDGLIEFTIDENTNLEGSA